jgi:oligopeptide transport system permease protein
VFRHELAPRDRDDLGVPLGEVAAPAFEDRLGLEARRYHYSVVPLRAGREAGDAATVRVEPRQAIAWSAAQRRGLLPAGAGHERIGTEVRLPAHPLGSDYLGRDILARIIHGARTSLFIGIVAPLLFVLAGLLYGGLAGYLGGRIDNAMMRLADFVVALPFLLFMILFKVAFGIRPGESGVMPMLLAMVLLGWPASARLVRGQVLAIRNEPYVQAARLMGAGTPYLVLRHMVPNVLGVLLVTLSFAIPGAIFTEAFLSFIGLGVVPPTPSWGSLCNDGIRSMLAHPHELAVPAAFISITVLAFNLLGDGLRDALDTRAEPP